MEAATARIGRGKRRKKKDKSYGTEERRLAALLLSPAMVVILLVAAYPIGYAVWLSLTEYSVRVPGLWRFVGFDNYSEAFGSTEFWDAVKTTFLFTIISVTLELAIGLAMALAMHAAFKGRGLLRTVILVPWAVLTVVSAITWKTLFEPNLGLVPTILGKFGIAENVVWLGQSGYALTVMIVADVWKTAPFMALLLLAGLQVIPDDVYDAAKVDGATTWQRFRSITLPLLLPAILVALIFRTLDALRIFDLPFVLTGGTNGTSTLSLIAQKELTTNNLIGYGSALSVLTFIIVMAVSFIYIKSVGGNIRSLAEDD
ncbi:MAG TPA: sugar ABC transporter permease [Thermoleophilaceae bacterium]|jgi:multiple sugar transport system permease protein|nr:sugar ABC transporter permease [Thermoleophilaceae bacterium]